MAPSLLDRSYARLGRGLLFFFWWAIVMSVDRLLLVSDDNSIGEALFAVREEIRDSETGINAGPHGNSNSGPRQPEECRIIPLLIVYRRCGTEGSPGVVTRPRCRELLRERLKVPHRGLAP